MPEVRDSAIKLFGRNIPVPECRVVGYSPHNLDASTPFMDSRQEAIKMELKDPTVKKSHDKNIPADKDEFEGKNGPSLTRENGADVHDDSDEGQDKKSILKKPDKVIPCPRCNSLATKFCYFNNYNVNQPRHFCKNCQRYWTAGGTIRNVPVGAGRRKNKPLPPQYCQVGLHSDRMPFTQVDTRESSFHHHLPWTGIPMSSVPTTDAPSCESIETVLNLKDQKAGIEMQHGSVGDNGEEPSSSNSSLTSITVQENKFPEPETERVYMPVNYDGYVPTHPSQCYPIPPMTYPWNPLVFAPNTIDPNTVCVGSPMMAVPGFCTQNMPIPFSAASYWSCPSSWPARSWNLPCNDTTGGLLPSSPTSKNGSSGNSLPILGKHSRDATSHVEDKQERSIWIPKTLRIEDPQDAAKSSIWSTLNIKTEKNKPFTKGGIFKAFQLKSETTANISDSDNALQVNPAALSRSSTFQESL